MNSFPIQAPEISCNLCHRLAVFREANRAPFPAYYNGAVPAFGSLDASVLIVGLAPGLHGANATGRPFTGDYAGDVLYESLLKCGFARGDYKERADDGLELNDCRISNAVRCVPPENKPEPGEIKTCNQFLKSEIAAMPNLRVIVSLGLISHKAVLMALGLKQSSFTFGHGNEHKPTESLILLDTYHCSRYNINTRRLTQGMFDVIIARAKTLVNQMNEAA